MAATPDVALAEPWAPLGRALLDYHRGDTQACFRVSSSLWEDEDTPVADYYRPLNHSLPEIENRALARCRGSVLDLGAGAGRHALELQTRGHRVTAVELCPEAVQVMQERGVVDARCADFYSLEGGRYDTLLMLMHGLGVVGTLAGLRRFLRWARDELATGGSVICDSADLSAELREAGLLPGPLGSSFGYYGEVSFRLSYGKLEGPPYPWLFADPETLRREATTAGYHVAVISRGLRGGYLAQLTRN